MIPKTLYLYWGGKKLSWLRYLTVVSFKRHNPDWDIKVYYPAVPSEIGSWGSGEHRVAYEGGDWFEKLSEYAELIPLDMKDIHFSNSLPEVHKSDVFRLWALYTMGGVYSDFDILYFKPIPSPAGRWFCLHPDGHYAIGLLAARPNDPLYKKLLVASRRETGNKYQSYGSTLWQKVTDGHEPAGWNIPKSFVYCCDWQHAASLFTSHPPVPGEAIGLHWYGGSVDSGQWENRLEPSTVSNHRSLIHDLVKEYA